MDLVRVVEMAKRVVLHHSLMADYRLQPEVAVVLTEHHPGVQAEHNKEVILLVVMAVMAELTQVIMEVQAAEVPVDIQVLVEQEEVHHLQEIQHPDLQEPAAPEAAAVKAVHPNRAAAEAAA
tara:strand:+ start:131 stop:496 length:366 start_codon:yes stop_codon:yes gene_type:complete